MNVNELDSLKKKLLKSNWKIKLESVDKLVAIGCDEVVQFFIRCLSSNDPGVRNSAALGLREISDPRAVQPLIDGVINPIDPKRCGTLAYSLETHDCSNYFLNIFRILFYSNFECKLSAHNILSEQKFSFTEKDLIAIKEMWSDCIVDPIKCPEFEDLREGIQDDVDSFLSYLDDDK